MLQIWKSTTLRIAAGIALLLAVYALLGFVVAPRLVRSALLEDIPAKLSATPAVGAIHVNPFLFQVTVDDFALTGAGGAKLLGFRRLFIDFELSSIWHRAYSFVNIDVTEPYVDVAVAADGSLNLRQLQPKTVTTAPEKGEPLPAIRIGSLKVLRGLLVYEDRSRADAFAARLEPINFELREFTTGVEGGRFTFTGASKLGERIEWHGHVSVDPLESDGEFQVDGLLAHTLWEYLQDRVNFVLDRGSIDVAGTYTFALKDAATDSLHIDVSKATLRDLAVSPKPVVAPGVSTAAAAPWIVLPELSVTGTTVDLAKRQAHVDRVALTGVALDAWLEPDGSVNLLKLAATPDKVALPSATAVPAVPKLTTTQAPSSGAGPPWVFDLRQLDLRDARIAVEDRTVHPAVKVLLAPLALQVNGVSQDLRKPVTVMLDTHINERGALNVSGEVTLQPVVADVAVKLSGIDLAAIQPYLAQHTAMTLLSGTLAGDGKLHYGAQPKMPSLRFTGNVHVDGVHTVDDTLHDDFINWDHLDVLGLDYAQAPDRIDIDQIVARKLYARVIIEADASANVKRVLKIPLVVAGPAASAGAPAKAQSRPAAAAAVVVTTAGKPVPMSIRQVRVQASQMNFTDLSVLPNFSAGIQKLEGTVTGLSSKPTSRATVNLQGAVDTFSPVSITGEVNVLGPLYTDLIMSFRNISLPVFNPYSGKFAGYNIEKGKLTTELHYKVDGRKLDAQHHIVIEQLEFGAKTASKDAVSLPIKLAVALLKDRNGVIDLNIPVAGTLDDPQFRLGPVIWQVFVNLLEKAVTAPFALLGSMFGAGPDIQFIEFEPGVSTLDAAATDKVKTVAKALLERPQLKIEVPIAVLPELDGPALVKAQFDARLAAAQTAKAGPAKAAAAALPAPDSLDPASRLALLTVVYGQVVGGEPRYPDTVTGLKSKPELVAAKNEFVSHAIRERIVVGDAELQTLGQQRAMTLQQALLTDTQVESERVFLVANDKASAKDGVVRLELTLQ